MAPRVQRHFAPLSLRCRFSPERMLSPQSSRRRQIFPLVDISPVVSVAPVSPTSVTQDSQENPVGHSLLDGVKVSAFV